MTKAYLPIDSGDFEARLQELQRQLDTGEGGGGEGGGQPLDATLTALAGLNATPGLVEQTGSDTFTKRALGVAATTSVPTRADGDARWLQITSYTAVRSFSNVAEVAALNGSEQSSGMRYQVRCYVSANDGGQGEYTYISTSIAADGVVVVAPADNIGRFIRSLWLNDNVILARWWGLTVNSAPAQLANGALITAIFDFVRDSTEGGTCQFPQGIIYIEMAAAYTFTKQRGWTFDSTAGSSGLFDPGTRIYLRGGGMDYFVKYRSVQEFHWKNILFLIDGSGMSGHFDIGGGNYYDTDAITPIDTAAISSYLCSFERCMFQANRGAGFEPGVAAIFVHSSVANLFKLCWITNCNRAIKLGENGESLSDPDNRALAKGSAGQTTFDNCLIDGDVGYVKCSEIGFRGGQITKQSGVASAARAAIFEQMAGAVMCNGVTFDAVGIGYAGDKSTPFISSTLAKGITVMPSCTISTYSVFAEADGTSDGWDISPTHHFNAPAQGTGILRILSTCSGKNFRSSTPPDPDQSYGTKDERLDAYPLALVSAAPRPTLMHNSKFDVWQRGTSFVPGGQIFMADRWKGRRSANAAGSTYSRQAGFLGAQYCMRVQRNNGDTGTNILYIGHQIFSADCYALQGRTIFISAAMRSGADFSAASGHVTCTVYTGTGVDEVGDVATGFTTGNVTTHLLNQPLSTTAGIIDFGAHVVPAGAGPIPATEILIVFRFTPVGTAGATDYFEITNVNVTLGAQPSPYLAPRVSDEEWALLPYCDTSFRRGTTPAQNNGVNTSEVRNVMTGTAAVTNYLFTRWKRRLWGTPTIVLYNPAATNVQPYNVTDAADCSAVAGVSIDELAMTLSYTGNAAGTPGDQVGIHYLATAGV